MAFPLDTHHNKSVKLPSGYTLNFRLGNLIAYLKFKKKYLYFNSLGETLQVLMRLKSDKEIQNFEAKNQLFCY